jgi:hypothetical protein
VNDEEFPGYIAGRLAELPHVEAVNLGGSRGQGTHRPDSDWDFAIYYRGHFDPQALRDVGWPGEVFGVGGWGGGVFNSGAFLSVTLPLSLPGDRAAMVTGDAVPLV